LYVACWAFVARSFDGGVNWEYTSMTTSDNKAIACDPDIAGKLYVGSNGGGVHMSTDAGVSFTAINDNLGNLSVHCLEIDSQGRLLAGTSDGVYIYSEDEIPTLTEWGMIILALLLLLAGTLAIIRRRKLLAARQVS
jgi:ligand-binding sensor domain-containing protein